MDSNSFGAFQQQITRNQDELKDYLKDLDSWKESISKKDRSLAEKTDDATQNCVNFQFAFIIYFSKSCQLICVDFLCLYLS